MAMFWDDDEDDDDLLEAGGQGNRSPYEPEPSEDEIRDIILEVMREGDVTPVQIPNEGRFVIERAEHSKRYFETKGFAWFCCPEGHNRWPSAHSWCFLDLKKQVICHRYTQDCRKNKCETSVDPGFTEEAVEKMAKYAVKKFLTRTGRRARSPKLGGNDGDRKTEGGPHDEDRCARCRRLGRSCWQ